MKNAYALLGLSFLIVFIGVYLVLDRAYAPTEEMNENTIDSEYQRVEAARTVAQRHIEENSAEGLQFDLEFTQEQAGWIQFRVLPVDSTQADPAQIFLEDTEQGWEVIAFGTAFPGLRDMNPEFFETDVNNENEL